MASQACEDAGAPLGWQHTDAGKVDALPNGARCYITGSAASAQAPVLIVTDIFGIDYPQVRNVADRLAGAGKVPVGGGAAFAEGRRCRARCALREPGKGVPGCARGGSVAVWEAACGGGAGRGPDSQWPRWTHFANVCH